MRHLTARFMMAAAVMYALALAPINADDPVSSNVTFNRDVLRIIQRKCEPCHAPDGLAISLSDYRDARTWGRAIREELVEHRMPPAVVARGYGRYETDPSLNAREMATFLTWLDGGMPRGDEADRPPAVVVTESAESSDPDTLRLSLPAQTVRPGEEIVVRRVTISAAAAAGRAIARVQVRPGNRRVLRGALVFAGSPHSRAGGEAGAGGTTRWIGGWLPWQHAVVPPSQYAFYLPPDSSLDVELYYRAMPSEPAEDRSVIELTFAPETATGHVDDIVLEATPLPQRTGRAATRARGSTTLAAPTAIWAIQPLVNPSVASMEVRAERPDKSVEILLWIPKARADWPLALIMHEPVLLPAGSIVSLVVETTESGRPTVPLRTTLSVLREDARSVGRAR